MKQLFLLSIVLCIHSLVYSYNKPESIVYDAEGDRYFVSNKAGNSISILKDGVTYSFISSGLKKPRGLFLKGDTLISVNKRFIIAFNINDGSKIFKYRVHRSRLLNDITVANEDYMYVTDTRKDVIYKISIIDGRTEIFMDSGINNPKGILYDQYFDRLLVCTWEKDAKIYGVNISDASVTMLAEPGCSYLNGLALDNTWRVHFSCKSDHKVYSYYIEDFTEKPVIVSENHDGPADITINLKDNILAVPNYYSNTVELIKLMVYPESVVYDPEGERYFISNPGEASILVLKDGILGDYVTSGLLEPLGLFIKGNTLICVNNTWISGFKLTDGSEVFKYPVPGTTFMNDGTHANDGYMYVTEFYKNIIYKISIEDGTIEVFSESEIINPNGILFDSKNNRLLVCNWGDSAKIYGVSLTDARVTELATPGYSDFDGLAFDENGRVYFSSWGENKVFSYDPEFKNSPVMMSENHYAPADIAINLEDNILAVPNLYGNTVDFIDLSEDSENTESIEDEDKDEDEKENQYLSNKKKEMISVVPDDLNQEYSIVPNPVENYVNVNTSFESYTVLSVNGKVLMTGLNTTNRIRVSELQDGIYVLVIKKDGRFLTQKFIK